MTSSRISTIVNPGVDVPDKTRIVIKSGRISLEPYMKDNEKVWPKGVQIVVFAWDYPEARSESQGNMDKPPVVEDFESDELPF